MSRSLSWFAVLYVALLPVGRSGLPSNAQWGDLLFPLVALASFVVGARGRFLRRSDWPVAFYLSVTLLTSLVSPGPTIGLKELVKQMYVASIFLVFRQLADDPSLSGRLQRTYVLACAAVTVVSTIVVFSFASGQVPLSTFGIAGRLPLLGVVARLRGAFESPELLGNALLVAIMLTLGFRETASDRARAVWTAATALLAAGVFLTFSHSVAGLSVALACFAAPSMRSRMLRALAWSAASAIVVIVNLASVVDPIPRDAPTAIDVRAVSFKVFGTRVEGRMLSYAALKGVAWTLFLEHPLTGVGPGRFPLETGRAVREGRLAPRQRGLVPHCAPAGRLAESGVLGGLSLLVLWAGWLRGARTILSTGTTVRRALVAAVVGLLVNSLNADVMNFRFLWLAVAWIDSAGAERG